VVESVRAVLILWRATFTSPCLQARIDGPDRVFGCRAVRVCDVRFLLDRTTGLHAFHTAQVRTVSP
jgi:hypothetical protein